ncbi:isoprenylcysteine carboxylmethyltransferase family protein [Methylosinus sp. H3A]|uniref:methyltransferase family protein n=1 Tax=Methylosinus sp. H3A TaxID=2785786 RepID=UPI0018C2DA32|nr:isoprenylcysteine carboxylmethyltransferase family protein [Methylosinus sp. H3A]MBG0810642.1 isoprenylcysteine carboxylmethyltransferase family protein [Methylosinus sp. H3A]
MKKLATAASAIFFTLAYLGVAALGAGGVSAFLVKPPLVALALVTLALAVAAAFSQGHLGAGEREDRGNRWVLAAFGVIGLLDAFLPAYTDRLDILTIGGDGLRWIGVILSVIGGVVRLWPVFVLGRRFSGLVAIQPGHELVTTGVYAHIRNPSYLGLLIGFVGWALAFRSIVGLLLAAATIPPLVARMKSEEALLASHFGATYEAYRARTARLVPGLY